MPWPLTMANIIKAGLSSTLESMNQHPFSLSKQTHLRHSYCYNIIPLKQFYKNIFLIFVFLAGSLNCISQVSSPDSVYLNLDGFKDDTVKFKKLCKNLEISINNKQVEITDRFFNEAIRLLQITKYKRGVGTLVDIISHSYMDRGNYQKALDDLFILKGVAEKLEAYETNSGILNAVGILYWYQQDYKNALLFYNENVEFMKKHKLDFQMAPTYNNMGLVYRSMGNYEKAITYYNKGLELGIKRNDLRTCANSYNNIGVIYQKKSDYYKALYYFQKSLDLRMQRRDSIGIATSLGNMGACYFWLGKYKDAEDYYKQSYGISNRLDDLEGIKEISAGLSDVYSATGRDKEALLFYKTFTLVRDSLNNEETKRDALKKEMEFKFEQEAQKKSIIADADKRRQTIFTYSFVTIIIVISLFSILLYKRFRLSQNQKAIIEIKNKETLDSINYAKRIQQAMLKSEEFESKHLPQHFIFFKPKDIVSGDFYWTLEKQDHLYITAGDCTGHGVPGAFVTMLGVSFLNEINAHDKLIPPAEMLDKLRERIIKELGQSGKEDENKDGMDISLARLNLKTNEMQWAGANNPLFYFQNNELHEIRADKQPVAFYTDMKPFTNHTLQLKKGDSIYLITDGYADQFGGPDGKKFKYKKLKELIESNINLPMEEQKQIFANEFEAWRGNLEQVDDVCVIGIKI